MSSKASTREKSPGSPFDPYRAIFQHSREPIAIIDPKGRYLEQNAAHAQLLGYTDAELQNQTPAIHLGEKVFAEIARELADKGDYQGEVTSNTKTDEVRHIELSAFAMRNDSGEPICYVVIERDITERKQAEQALQRSEAQLTDCFTGDITERKRTESRLALQYAVTQILSESHDFVETAQHILQAVCDRLDWEVGALWKVDRQTGVLRFVDICHATAMATPEFDRLTQISTFAKGQGLPGRIWASAQPAWIENVIEDRNFLRASAAAREGLHGAFGFPILIGGEVWGVIEFFSPEIREPDDEVLKLVAGIAGQVGQFTERKRAEEESAELFKRESAARADAEKANRLKDEFLATLSHELRTPLNAVIGWSRMLGSGSLDRDSSKHALEVIERNAWAQKQIIEDILDVSRVITGKLQLNLNPVDLVTLVDAALDAVRPAMEAKEIKIETIIDASLRMISGDADRLQQVIWNLLSNAAKFTPNGGRVEISVSQTTAHVQIQVKDSGPGIDPKFLPHVFERFRQADGSTTRTHGGLGLGLAIVRHLVELHGGTIAVENRENGHGAIFTIQLPLPSGELRPETLAHSASVFREAQSEVPSLDGLRILVVDDETDALDLIGVELAQHGAKVTGVGNAADALTALEQSEFDLLISDIGMPKTDGYDLIRQIRNQEEGKNQKIPAVALTAYARVQDRMQAVMAGFSTHIAKPVEVNELVTVVASLAGRLGAR
jgi:PAS domain S-box-containing protein